MFKIKKGILYQFGKELISSMRITRKRKEKDIDTGRGYMLSSDTAFVQSANSLALALEIAEYNRDIDAILAISDRWAILGRVLERDETVDNRIPIGFSTREEEAQEHDHS